MAAELTGASLSHTQHPALREQLSNILSSTAQAFGGRK